MMYKKIPGIFKIASFRNVPDKFFESLSLHTFFISKLFFYLCTRFIKMNYNVKYYYFMNYIFQILTVAFVQEMQFN